MKTGEPNMGMDVGKLAANFVAARAAQMQLAVAAALMRMDAQQEVSVAKLIAAATETAQEMASSVAESSHRLDVRV